MPSVRSEPADRPSLQDAIAGVSVALMLIPQALAYAAVAGMPPHRGLYGSILPLVAGAAFASSPYLQTGPTALSSLLTYSALVTMTGAGSAEFVRLGVLLALMVGVVRLALGLLRAGNFAYLLSEPALLGFTNAAGLLIIASQVHDALGVDIVGGGLSLWLGSLLRVDDWRFSSMLLATFTIAMVMGSRRVHALLPGALVATLVGITFAALGGYQGPRVGTFPARVGEFSLALPWGAVPSLLMPALVIAVVGFAEASATARIFTARERVRWDPHRELVGQGVANIVAGLAGAFPISGSFSRSMLNWLAGAKTRWSGGFAGLAVLVLVPVLPVLAHLPRAVLAGIVIAAAVGFVRPGTLIGLWRYSRLQFLVAWTTFALTIVLAPRVDVALLIGVTLAAGVHLWSEIPIEVSAWGEGETLHLRPSGVLWFGSAPRMEQAFLDLLSRNAGARQLVIHLDGLGRVDLTGALLLRSLVADSQVAGIAVELRGAHSGTVRALLRALGMGADVISSERPSPVDVPAPR